MIIYNHHSYNRSRSRDNSKSQLDKAIPNLKPIILNKNRFLQTLEKKIEKKKNCKKINIHPNHQKILNMDPRILAIERLLIRKIEQNQYFKLNLVLDIDETLISSLYKPEHVFIAKNKILNEGNVVNYSDLMVKLHGEEPCNILVIHRPKLKYFLETMSKYYNIYVYSHGMTKYIEEIINNIDPDKMINRKNIKTNDQKYPVSESTRKCLSKLNLHDKESLRKTLIIDDILNVWLEEYSKNVIISKKYIPFYEMSDNKNKNNGYYLVFDQEIKQYLSFAPSNCNYYIDKALHEYSTINQLENLTNKLVEISSNYNKNLLFFNDYDRLDVTILLEEEMKKIMKGKCLAINEIETLGRLHSNIQHLTKQLIEKMGGSYISQSDLFKKQDVRYLIVDKENLEKKNILMLETCKLIALENKENNRDILIIDNKWITDCYFNMSLIDPMKYYIPF